MKTMRFQPGTFLEIDDFAGGRLVVMVCKDGVTYWDMLDAKDGTPIVIHPSMNPIELGTLVDFCASKALQASMRKMISFFRESNDDRLNSDPLFVMRVLWFVSQKASGELYEPDEAVLNWACAQAKAQQKVCSRIHGYAEKFCSMQSGG